MKTFKPSKYQEDIFKWVSTGKGNAIIQAVAGSGKTTTIIEIGNRVPKDVKSIFVAFNKAIATTLQEKLPNNVESRTLHSFGMSLFYGNTNSRPRLDNEKLFDTIIKVLDDSIISDEEQYKQYISILKKTIPLLKAEYIDYTDFGEVNDLFMRKDFEFQLDEEILNFIKETMDRCKKNVETIDFDDMIWIPIINNFKSHIYDFVFVDETQDLNRSQFELIKKMCGKNTRVIAVGDRRQSIYAFRGADSKSMNNFKEYFNAKELPLSICYRCPKSHIALAKEIVPEIEAWDDAIEGIVDNVSLDKGTDKMIDGNLVLCRTNAPLIKVAFALIRENKKAIVRGRDIGSGLLKLVNKYKAINLNDLLEKVMKFKSLQNDKLELIELGEYDRRKKGILMTAIDSCDTVLCIAENVETIEDLKLKINTIFSDKNEGIVCSSVHKAKGLEADSVYILNYELMPHPMAKTDEEIEQELNIQYVALTRSKRELYFIDGDTK